jgi:ubiquinone/menaquinone biosynthesis C-methylase UbiE
MRACRPEQNRSSASFASRQYPRLVTEQAYDAIAVTYAAWKFSTPPAEWSRRLLSGLQKQLGVGARVLDAGCGHGVELAAMRAAGLQPVGVDLSARMLAVARSTAPGAALLQADIARLPFAAASMDAVWSMHALLHVADLGGALREVSRVLRPGAPAALTFAVGAGATDEPVPYAPSVRRTFVHWSEDYIRDALGAARLNIEQQGLDHAGRTTMWVSARRDM